jgi:hypothetical protein
MMWPHGSASRIASKFRATHNLDPVIARKVENNEVAKSANQVVTKTLEPGGGNLNGRSEAWHGRQRFKGPIRSLEKADSGTAITLADEDEEIFQVLFGGRAPGDGGHQGLPSRRAAARA